MKENLTMTDIQRMGDGTGISVYCFGTERFKSENISIYFSLPNIKEDSVKRSLLLSVLKRGTEKYPSQKLINERLDELYATLVNLKNQKFEGTQLLGISADIINSEYTDDGNDLLPEVLDVIRQMLFCPTLDRKTGVFFEEYVKSEKENYKSIILSQINEPRTYAAIRCREETFNSLGIVDKLDTMCKKIDAVSSRELYKCYKDMVESANILVFYVGKRSAEEIMEHVRSAFSQRAVAANAIHKKPIKLLTSKDDANVIEESSDISQARLVMALNCGVTGLDEGYYAMLLCNEILGASPISKLMVNVREKLSLCYECSSVYNSARGVIFVTTGIDSENYELAKMAILSQLDDMKNGKISQTEFEAAKKSIINVYSAVADSPSAIERYYLGRLINGIDVEIADFLKKISDLTVADVVDAANKLSLHTVYLLRGDDSGEGESNDE